MSDRITLTGLAVTACHGVLDFEKRIPQPFVLDISLEADLGPAGRSDDLEASLSYADVAARAVQLEVAGTNAADLHRAADGARRHRRHPSSSACHPNRSPHPSPNPSPSQSSRRRHHHRPSPKSTSKSATPRSPR